MIIEFQIPKFQPKLKKNVTKFILNAFILTNSKKTGIMQLTYLLPLILSSSFAYASNHMPEPPDSLNKLIEPSIITSLDAFAEEAECWTPAQKQEFASVFFIERGKFTIPKEPIVLKSFEKP